MTASMTAFARRETATPWGGLVWELRAVNHRYLELSLKTARRAARHRAGGA